jgi:olefin beta-lactone synthetase
MPSSFINVAAHLPALAAKQPHTLAVVVPHGRDRLGRVSYVHWTYQQFNAETDRLAHGLEKIGIGRGVRTVLMVPPSLELFALTFALFKIGAVLVMVDPGMGIKNLGQCLAEAEPRGFIGVPKAHLARSVLGWAKRTVQIKVTVGRRLFWGGEKYEDVRGEGPHHPFAMPPLQPDDMAAVLFTSGSTGIPKGAVYTHGMFSSQVEMIRSMYDIQPGEIDLPTFPLFALFAPAFGWTSIIPDMDATKPASVDPKKIVEAIENWGVTTMFGSPALLDRVGQHLEQYRIKLPSLRRVLTAGAPVRPDILERFGTALSPSVQIHTPYGATEALPVATIGSEEILRETRYLTAEGKGNCVGKPVPGTEVKIIRVSDESIPTWTEDLVLPQGEIGEIVVRGPVVSRSYYNRPASTALHKIEADDAFYHRTGDIGYFDPQGRLWFCGRKSHRVITSQGTLFTICCEGVFNIHPQVKRTALVGFGSTGQAEPVLCVELKDQTANKQHVVKELEALAAKHSHTQSIKTFLFHPSFPVDIRHNAKIFREKLAVWAARQVS